MEVRRSFFWGLLGGVLLGLGAYAVAFGLQLGVPTSSSQWSYEINRRKAELARQAPRPALFLVGGSATLFGVSARQIEAATGLPTINLATHGALGPAYILHLAETVLQPGDIVLLTIEYELFDWGGASRNAFGDPMLLDYLVARDPDYLRQLPWRERLEIALALPFKRLKRGLLNRWWPEAPLRRPGVYTIQHLDDHGDQLGHRLADRPTRDHQRDHLVSSLVKGFTPNSTGVAAVRQFCQWAQAHQVRVIATFPPLVRRPEHEGAVAQAAERQLRDFYAGLGVPVIGSLRGALRPETEFFDTHYHLAAEAVPAHTEALLSELKPLLTPGR